MISIAERYDLKDVIFIDDSPEQLRRNYGNLVRVNAFQGWEKDRELPKLASYLETLRNVEDVRTIEKRGWLQTLVLSEYQ